jgi:hypothetical protein
MQRKYIIIIVIVIAVIILLLLSVLIFTIYKNKYNTDRYNKIYNLNYQGNKLYNNKNFILDGFLSSTATVITDPEIKEIYVNNVKVNLYIATIRYDILNYISDKPIGKISTKNDYMEKSKKLTENKAIIQLDKKLATPNSNPVVCEADIVVTRPIKKDENIIVYYKYGSTNQDRINPPFFLEQYINYFT